MGAVAIWSMHFIGNQAIILAGGNSNLQIAYNSVWTAGSFMLAIGGVAFAFFMFTITERVSVWRTLLGGLLTGAAICGMHYMGQAGISNYKNIFEIKSIVGAAIIAVFAATCALGLFFYLKSTWTNALWKRLCCAFVLGSGVSGMHWLAAFGTSYRSKAEDAVNSSGLSREMTVTIVGVLVGASG
jgi:NO-binding membrane sensor protein with MHYT domain